MRMLANNVSEIRSVALHALIIIVTVAQLRRVTSTVYTEHTIKYCVRYTVVPKVESATLLSRARDLIVKVHNFHTKNRNARGALYLFAYFCECLDTFQAGKSRWI